MQMMMNDLGAVATAPPSSPKVDPKQSGDDGKSFQNSLDNKLQADRENRKAADEQEKGTEVPAAYAAASQANPTNPVQPQAAVEAEMGKAQASLAADAAQQALMAMMQSQNETAPQVETPVLDLIQQAMDANAAKAGEMQLEVKTEVQTSSQASLQLLAQQETASQVAGDLNPTNTGEEVVQAAAQELTVDANEQPKQNVDVKDINNELAASQLQNQQPVISNTHQSLSTVNDELSAKLVLSQVTDNVKATIDAGRETIRLQLQPENLGKVDVRISRGSDGLQLTFTTETPSTSRLLQSTLNQLQQSLTEAGVKVGNMSVAYQGQQNSQQQTWQFNRKHSLSFLGQDDSEFAVDFQPRSALSALDTRA